MRQAEFRLNRSSQSSLVIRHHLQSFFILRPESTNWDLSSCFNKPGIGIVVSQNCSTAGHAFARRLAGALGEAAAGGHFGARTQNWQHGACSVD